MAQNRNVLGKQPARAQRTIRKGQGPLLPERLLAKLWQARAGRKLRTRDGRLLRVLYPGRPAPGHGPDFRDAVLELDGKPLRGDVEVHRTEGDWRVHKHHQDPSYDSVVLHVVGSDKPSTPPLQPALPTVVLARSVARANHSPAGQPPNGALLWFLAPARDLAPAKGLAPANDLALAKGLSPEQGVRRLLQEAGLARYDERVEQASATLCRRGADQALCDGLLDALGYSENRAGFRQLGALLPMTLVRAVYHAHSAELRRRAVRALVMTGAGLEPTDGLWGSLVGLAPMDPKAWKTSGVRPGNHPQRRLEGLALLLDRHLGPGLAASLALRVADGPGALVESLTAVSGGPAWVGRGRALEIAVNVVLPTLDAWARAQGDDLRQARCRNLYLSLPALQENTLTREARRLMGNPHLLRLPLGACGQQGLIHLYRNAVAK